MTKLIEYALTEEQHKMLLDAMKPVPYLIIGGVEPRSQQENANDAWERLGEEMGFDYRTVKPSSRNSYYFLAEPFDEDAEELSRCCSAPLYEDTDICTACGEHN